MTDHSSHAVLERLRAIDWSDDLKAFEHANSRALLMREYLRRAALWARAYGAEQSWPFFDIAEHIAEAIRTPPEDAAALEEILSGLAPASLKITCRGAVRWAALRQAQIEWPGDLPDPYEPLILMYERGGGYFLEEFVDLNGAMIRLGNVESNLSAAPSSPSPPQPSTPWTPRARSRTSQRSTSGTPGAAHVASSGAGSTRAARMTRRSRATSAGSRPNTSGCTNSATTRSITSRSPRSKPPRSSNRR